MQIDFNIDPITGQINLNGGSEEVVAVVDINAPTPFVDLRNKIDGSSSLWRLVAFGLQTDVDGRSLRMQGYFGDILNTGPIYDYAIMSKKQAGAMTEEGALDSQFINMNLGGSNAIGNASDERAYLDCKLYDPGKAVDTFVRGEATFNSNSSLSTVGTWFSGAMKNEGAMDGLRLYPSVGNFVAGKVYLVKSKLFV